MKIFQLNLLPRQAIFNCKIIFKKIFTVYLVLNSDQELWHTLQTEIKEQTSTVAALKCTHLPYSELFISKMAGNANYLPSKLGDTLPVFLMKR